MRGVPPAAGPRSRALAQQAFEDLRVLAASEGPVDEAALDAVFAQLDLFHATFFEEAGVSPSCGRGCSSCCAQMVFDVHAFEVERIATRLIREGRAEAVRRALRERVEAYDRCRRDDDPVPGESADDRLERVAVAFWSQARPCALLTDDGACSVHDIRPWSCRRAFALGDPALCRGETARDPERASLLVEPTEAVDELLGALDRHVAFEPDTDRLDLALLRRLDHEAARDDDLATS